MDFKQNIKLLNTYFIYGILYFLILQLTVHVLTQVLIRILNVCSFTGAFAASNQNKVQMNTIFEEFYIMIKKITELS